MIPVATTTISVWRAEADATRDGWDAEPTRTRVKSGLRAIIASSVVHADIATGDKVVIDWRLTCDPFDFQDDDQITDETTDETFILLGVAKRSASRFDHCMGKLRQISGAA